MLGFPVHRVPSLLGLLLLAALPARADDFYVDAVFGDDTNSGTTENDAWKTLTHAVPSLPGGKGHVLHIAPGVYDAALGENFPIAVPAGVALIGEQGWEVTIVDGGGAPALFSWIGMNPSAWETLFQGLWLRNAVRGMDGTGLVETTYWAHLTDGRLSDLSDAGIRARAYTFLHDDLYLVVDLERMQVENCGDGVVLVADCTDDSGATALLGAKDSVIRGCGGGLMAVGAHFVEAFGGVSAERCLFEGNDGGMGGDAATADDCLFISNGSAIGAATYGCDVRSCTITANGKGVTAGWLDPSDTTVSNSIVYGNTDDLSENRIVVQYSDIGEPGWEGKKGNISVDPAFADPAAGDYRLRFGSPCIDVGQPAAVLGTDLVGTPRRIDGDLDAVERPDMGAYEHAPLFVQGEPRIGSTVDLELWGPAGGATRIFWTRGPTVPPLHTPFGDFDLDRTKVIYFGASPVAPGPPVTVPFAIPNVPTLVGESFSFQAMTVSPYPGLDAAYTNAVTLVIEP